MGKTFTLKKAAQLSRKPFFFTAVSGAAASLYCGGMTLCSWGGFNPSKRGSQPSSKIPLIPLSPTAQQAKFTFLTENYHGKHGVLVIDEMSMLTALYFFHVYDRHTFLPDENNNVPNDTPWAGHDVILSGDWNQIPGVGVSIPDIIYRVLIEPSSSRESMNDLELEAYQIFKRFTRAKLTEQMRSNDDAHNAHIASFTDTSHSRPITRSFINHLKEKVLKEDDVRGSDSPWIHDSVFLTSSNIERAAINLAQATLLAKLTGNVLIKWALKSTTVAGDLSNDEMIYLIENYPETAGYFMKGAPAVLTQNLKPELGLSNGSVCRMHSLIFDSAHTEYRNTQDRINNAIAGETVIIFLAPQYVVIEYKYEGSVTDFSTNMKIGGLRPLVADNMCIAIKTSTTVIDTLKNAILGTPQGRVLLQHNYYVAGVEFMYALTFEKSQGKTINNVILCLNKNPYRSPTLAALYVAFTRVTSGDHLRVLSTSNILDLDRLRNLEHNKKLILLEKVCALSILLTTLSFMIIPLYCK
jgi:hypothetical protein